MILYDSKHLAALGPSLKVPIKYCYGVAAIHRTCTLLRRSFPRCFGPLALFEESLLESRFVEIKTTIAGCVSYEIERQAIGVIKLESISSD